MQTVKIKTDNGVVRTQERWAGNYLTEEAYDQVISATEDTVIFKPGASLYDDVPLAYVVCNAYPNSKVIECLKTIEETTTMRANASGPILEEDMKKKGITEYKLRSPNSYHVKTKKGEWGMIAYANEIHSVMVGAKRGRFTGKINISNSDKWKELKDLCFYNEKAFKKADPEIYNRQKKFAEEAIKPEHRHGMITTLSANRYSSLQSRAMSVHSDGKDVEYTTMCAFRQGDYEGAYLSFPRWGVGLDLPDNCVCIADSQSLHCVTSIHGSGQRFTTVAYTDRSCATLGNMGKSERLIGRFAKKESGNLEDFI